MRVRRTKLRRVHWKMEERVLEDRPPREDGHAVLPAVEVERAAECDVEAGASREHGWLVHVAGAASAVVHFLEEHDVGATAAHQLRDTSQVVDALGVLASVDVVDQHLRVSARALGGVGSAGAGADDDAERERCRGRDPLDCDFHAEWSRSMVHHGRAHHRRHFEQAAHGAHVDTRVANRSALSIRRHERRCRAACRPSHSDPNPNYPRPPTAPPGSKNAPD